MERYFIKPTRLAVCAFFMASLLVLYTITLYRLQIIEGEQYLNASTSTEMTSVTRTVPASRGALYDRNGTLLAADRAIYKIKIDRSVLLRMENRNEVISTLTAAAAEFGVQWNDAFPVTRSAPFEWDATASKAQMNFLKTWLEYFKNSLDPNISASELMAWLRNHYKISYTVPAEEARRIIGVRYELELRAIVNTTDYFFVSDAPVEFVSYVEELKLPCVSVILDSVREYYTEWAAHILGYTGAVGPEEYKEKYKALGYPLDATIGLAGAEAAFEEYLHGTDGKVTTWYDPDGVVVDLVTEKEAVAGGNVYLSIDIAFQEQVERILASNISLINFEREQEALKIAEETNSEPEPIEEVDGGAVVVLDVHTGEVLALASWPTYNPMTRLDNWVEIQTTANGPLFNRATRGIYNPGSTFKMVTALAGLRKGVIHRYTPIEDKGKYTVYEETGYAPTCWAYPYTHGVVDVVGALENSCNYFFYWVGDHMDIDDLAATAAEFGLGSPTGIELGEKTGVLATREYKMEHTGEQGWWKADQLITSIGQGLNEFTPVQLANYCAALANGGTLYTDTILRYIANFDYTRVLIRRSPEIIRKIDDSEGYFEYLQQGMRAVAATGTARKVFQGFSIKVACKTGTMQQSNAEVNDAAFICYAPADNPQIAVAIIVENGGSGSGIAPIGKEVVSAWYKDTKYTTTFSFDNTPMR